MNFSTPTTEIIGVVLVLLTTLALVGPSLTSKSRFGVVELTITAAGLYTCGGSIIGMIADRQLGHFGLAFTESKSLLLSFLAVSLYMVGLKLSTRFFSVTKKSPYLTLRDWVYLMRQSNEKEVLILLAILWFIRIVDFRMGGGVTGFGSLALNLSKNYLLVILTFMVSSASYFIVIKSVESILRGRLVLPSKRGHESWGLVVNEAMTCGLPVAVSDGVGCRIDLVEGKGTGCVFESENADSLGQFLWELLKNPTALIEMADRSRITIVPYSSRKVADNIYNAMVPFLSHV